MRDQRPSLAHDHDLDRRAEARGDAIETPTAAVSPNAHRVWMTPERRNVELEELKNEMQKLSQMQQALSAVLDKMSETAGNSIRKI